MEEKTLAKSPSASRLGIERALVPSEEGKKKRKDRIWEVDFLRGFFFLGVILFHLAWDFASLPSFFTNWREMASTHPDLVDFSTWAYQTVYGPTMIYWVYFFSGGFLFLTGVSCSLSRSNLLRSVKILLVAGLFTGFTYAASQIMKTDVTIVFGILHAIGTSLLVYSVFEWASKKLFRRGISPWILLVIGMSMVGYGWYLIYGTDVPYYTFDQLTPERFFQVVLGLAASYSDHFGLFPHMGKVLVGIAVGKWLYGGRRGNKSILPKLDGWWNRPFLFLGRHTFAVYILHQPVMLAVLFPVLLSMGYTIV